MSDDSQRYRTLIDQLVHDCREGQGQIAAERARAGVWNRNASPRKLPDQHEINVLLKALKPQQREVLARMLAQEFVSGVHQALATLHDADMPPFDKAYEGTPYHDFIGRLDGWQWPKHDERA